MFIIIQLVLIIDFAHSWAETWGEYHKQSNDASWFYALLAVTGVFYILTLVTVIVSYSYYTGSVVGQCKLHEFFITFNMLLCVVLTVTSVLPKVNILNFLNQIKIFLLCNKYFFFENIFITKNILESHA